MDIKVTVRERGSYAWRDTRKGLVRELMYVLVGGGLAIFSMWRWGQPGTVGPELIIGSSAVGAAILVPMFEYVVRFIRAPRQILESRIEVLTEQLRGVMSRGDTKEPVTPPPDQIREWKSSIESYHLDTPGPFERLNLIFEPIWAEMQPYLSDEVCKRVNKMTGMSKSLKLDWEGAFRDIKRLILRDLTVVERTIIADHDVRLADQDRIIAQLENAKPRIEITVENRQANATDRMWYLVLTNLGEAAQFHVKYTLSGPLTPNDLQDEYLASWSDRLTLRPFKYRHIAQGDRAELDLACIRIQENRGDPTSGKIIQSLTLEAIDRSEARRMHPLSRAWDIETTDPNRWIDISLTVFADPAMVGGPMKKVYRVTPDGMDDITP